MMFRGPICHTTNPAANTTIAATAIAMRLSLFEAIVTYLSRSR